MHAQTDPDRFASKSSALLPASRSRQAAALAERGQAACFVPVVQQREFHRACRNRVKAGTDSDPARSTLEAASRHLIQEPAGLLTAANQIASPNRENSSAQL